MPKKQLRTMPLVMLAMLTALAVLMSSFISVNTALFKIDTSFLPVALAGYYYGPLGGLLVGALGDLIRALCFPTGAYYFPFTLTAAAVGAWFGFALRKSYRFRDLLLAVLPTQIVCSLLLNSYFISLLFQKEIWSYLWKVRLPQVAIMIPVELICLHLLFGGICPRLPLMRQPLHKKILKK